VTVVEVRSHATPTGGLAAETLAARALARWPRLDRDALRRCGGDVERIAALVSRRTALPPEAIVAILTIPEVSEDETRHWFG
jgi:hypothetical protein